MHLESQHLGGWVRGVGSLRPARATQYTFPQKLGAGVMAAEQVASSLVA